MRAPLEEMRRARSGDAPQAPASSGPRGGEPLVIGRRLARCLGAALLVVDPLTGDRGEPSYAVTGDRGETSVKPPQGDRAPVVVLDESALARVPVARLRRAPAVVVVGAAGRATSADLRALERAVVAVGASVALSTFAAVASADGRPTEAATVVATWSADRRLHELLAAGPHSLLLDPIVVAAEAASAPAARVCVATFEVAGMTGGGIGTASTALAESLARAGHDVVLLFTGWQEAGAEERNERRRERFAEHGVRLEILRQPGTSSVKSPFFSVRCSYELHRWLRREGPFDVVHVPENLGHGYFPQLAKRQGSDFAKTTFVVGTHGPTRWAAEANRTALTREEFLVNDFLERSSVAHADVLLGPSRYLHEYMRDRAWEMPARVHVQPYALPAAVRSRAESAADRHGAGSSSRAGVAGLPDEIVFFGRIETRKGVVTLCDALDLLAAGADRPDVEVTFLGPVSDVLGEQGDVYIAGRARRWPWTWRIISDRDQQGAAEYLRRPGVLAVMPSLVDNAPNTVSEAVALGIPLIASRAGGTGELIRADRRDDHTFGDRDDCRVRPLPLDREASPVDPRPLADLLRNRLATRVGPADPTVPAAVVDSAYDRWHRAAAAAATAAPVASAPPAAALPSLAICLVHEGDVELLDRRLDALSSQGADREVEVVVADVRGVSGDDLPPLASALGAEVVRAVRAGHGAARAAAVAEMTAELVAIVPSADVPLAAFAARVRRVAAVVDADVYTFPVLDGRDGDPGDDGEAHAFVPVGGPPYAGLTHPAFSVGPYVIRRAALARIGGFTTDASGDEVDHELLNRAVAAGLRVEVIPEPLATKRRSGRWADLRGSRPRAAAAAYDAEQWLCVERPFGGAAGADIDLLSLLRGARGELAGRDARLLEQRAWIDDLEAAAAQLRIDREDLLAELDDMRRRAACVEASTSWRITRPLRLLRRSRG